MSLSNSSVTQLFAGISKQVSSSLEGSDEGRGTKLQLQRKPLLKQGPVRKPVLSGAWQRVLRWVELRDSQELAPALRAPIFKLIQFLESEDCGSPAILKDVKNFLAQDSSDAKLVEALAEHVKTVVKKDKQEQKQSYLSWLQQGAQGSLKPILSLY